MEACEQHLQNISNKSNEISSTTKTIETEIKSITVKDENGKGVLDKILEQLEKLNEKL